MSVIKEKPYLILLLALLLVAKLVILPIYEWQNSQLTELQLLKNQVSKADYAIANRELYLQKSDQLEQQWHNAKQRLFAYQPESAFKLEQQKNIEKLVTDLGLNVVGAGWLQTKNITDYGLSEYRMKLTVKGDGVKLPLLTLTIESGEQWIAIEDFNISLRRQGKTSIGEANGQFTLVYFMLNQQGNGNKAVES